MIGIKPIGSWGKVRSLLRHKKRRLEVVRHKIMMDFTEKFRDLVISKIPDTKEGVAYKEAIQTRELAGSFSVEELGYALIADPEEMMLYDLNQKETVVYIVPINDKVEQLSALLINNSPWVISRLPKNIGNLKDIKLVHRTVTENEADKVQETNINLLKKSKKSFEKAGAKYVISEDEKIDQPKSMPDLVFMALRMEFGLYSKQVPHWKYAIKNSKTILQEMFADKKEYARYLNNDDFNDWVKPLKKIKKIPIKEFNSKFGDFQKKVEG